MDLSITCYVFSALRGGVWLPRCSGCGGWCAERRWCRAKPRPGWRPFRSQWAVPRCWSHCQETFSSLNICQNKLECFYPARFMGMWYVNAWSMFKWSTLLCTILILTSNTKNWQARKIFKWANTLAYFVIRQARRKEFTMVDTWAQCYETFYARNLLIFVMSYNVGPRQAFPT